MYNIKGYHARERKAVTSQKILTGLFISVLSYHFQKKAVFSRKSGFVGKLIKLNRDKFGVYTRAI